MLATEEPTWEVKRWHVPNYGFDVTSTHGSPGRVPPFFNHFLRPPLALLFLLPRDNKEEEKVLRFNSENLRVVQIDTRYHISKASLILKRDIAKNVQIILDEGLFALFFDKGKWKLIKIKLTLEVLS